MERIPVLLLVVASLILAGCDTAEPEKDGRIEDLVGTWKQVGGLAASYCHFYADGTYICDPSLDRVKDNIGGFSGKYAYEDGQYIDRSDLCADDGVYEFTELSNGNLKYVVIEDDCLERISAVVGSGSTAGVIEWELLP